MTLRHISFSCGEALRAIAEFGYGLVFIAAALLAALYIAGGRF